MYAEQKKLSLHEFNKRYPNFSKSDKEYNQLLEKKNKAEQVTQALNFNDSQK